MTITKKLQIKLSEQRSRLSAIGALDELTPEIRSELETLTAAHSDSESQLRAAITASASEDDSA